MENTYNQPSPIQNPVTWTCERLTDFEMEPDVDYDTVYPITKNCPVYENIAIGDILLEPKQYRREDIRVMHADPKMIPRVFASLNGKAFETRDLCDCVNMIGYSLTQFRTETDKHELAVTALQSGMIDTQFTHCLYRYEFEGKLTPPPTGWNSRDLEIIEPEFRPEDRVYVDKPSAATIAMLERTNGPYILKPVLKRLSCPPKYHELKMYGGKVMQYTHVGRGGLVYYKGSAKYRLMFENGYMTSEMASAFLKNEPSHLTSNVVFNNNINQYLTEKFGEGIETRVVVTRVVHTRGPHITEYALMRFRVGDNTENNRLLILNYLRYCVKFQTPVLACRDIQPEDGDENRVIILQPKDMILPSLPLRPLWQLEGEQRVTDLNRLIQVRPIASLAVAISAEELDYVVKRV